MNNAALNRIEREIVLIGGGHAHVSVLKHLAMNPLAGVRLTLISRDIHTPYSGMVPGLIAGHYSHEDCHIDLGPLSRFANARLIHASATGLDLQNQLVQIGQNRPPIHYDLLSINTGSTPGSKDVPGADQFTIPVKPIDRFLVRWQELIERIHSIDKPFRVVVVGGGAGGVELALSTQLKLKAALQNAQKPVEWLEYTLLTASPGIMHAHNPGVRKRFERIFGERDITLQTKCRVTEVGAKHVKTDSGDALPADVVFWVTSASAPDWPGKAGLATDSHGFIQVNEYLQSTSDPQVFAVGDVASLPDQRPKSGVFAVRQGPILARNLVAAITGKSFRSYRAQKNFLGLISTGDRYAVASRGRWSTESELMWILKDWIDRRFMQQFNTLPEMTSSTEDVSDETATSSSMDQMHCAGCGSKLGADILDRVLERLPQQQRHDVDTGLSQADDAAIISVETGNKLVQSIDFFRSFTDDGYTFARIASNHALSDLFAMGAEPQSALAIATLPYATESIQESMLYELMSGAVDELEKTNAILAGGHSGQGPELAFGLTVNGLIAPSRVWRKSGAQPDDALILTKPLGTGTLLAAEMRLKAKGRWIDNALESMLVSNCEAAACLKSYQVHACTDITGFGLLGHLYEILNASAVDATLKMDSVPALDGALDTLQQEIRSSLHPQNLRINRIIENSDPFSAQARFHLLFDPQTSGGLLVSIPTDQAQACIKELQHNGYHAAAIIGRINSKSSGEPRVKIL